MGEYYHRVLLLDPENPLLPRNYGKYLNKVEGDLASAEGCYVRALLACPIDADLLSLYDRVIWEASQEKEHAQAYFERVVQAAPDDW
jgi:tetratricopeptide (TPR) repeat protein